MKRRRSHVPFAGNGRWSKGPTLRGRLVDGRHLGFADRAPLRGGVREATLAGALRLLRQTLRKRGLPGVVVISLSRDLGIGFSSLCRRGFATEGVRGDRVGVKLSPRAIALKGA